MTAADYRLSEDYLDERFTKLVRRYVFDGYTPHSQAPTLVLLGGQPAAGKSRAVAAIAQRHPSNLVPLTGDELRQFHPAYDELLRSDPLLMPNATAQASGGWVKRSIDYAHEHRYNLMLEGVFRDPLMTVQTAQRFAEAGYSVEVVGLAVSKERSLLDSVSRYLHPGDGVARWTPATAHDSAYRMIPATLQACEDSPHVHRLIVTDRAAENLYANVRSREGVWTQPLGAAAAANEERARPPAPEHARGWLQTYLDNTGELLRRGEISSTTVPTLDRLAVEADRMAALTHPHSSGASSETQATLQQRRADIHAVLGQETTLSASAPDSQAHDAVRSAQWGMVPPDQRLQNRESAARRADDPPQRGRRLGNER